MKKNSLPGIIGVVVAALTIIASALANPLTLVWDRSPDDKGTNFISYTVYQANGTSTNFVPVSTGLTNNLYSTNITPGMYRFYVTAVNFWAAESVPSNTLTLPDTNAPAAPAQPILYVVVGSKTNIVKF